MAAWDRCPGFGRGFSYLDLLSADMALLPDDIYALQDLAGWVRRHGIYQVRGAIKHCLKEAEHAPDNVSLAESMEHALVVEAEAVADDSGSDGKQLAQPPAPVKPASTTSAKKRATYPKGHDKAGEFIPDDPSTPENEAFTEKGS